MTTTNIKKSVLMNLVTDDKMYRYTDINLLKNDSIAALRCSSKITLQVRRCIYDIQKSQSIEKVQSIIFNSYLSFQGQQVIK